MLLMLKRFGAFVINKYLSKQKQTGQIILIVFGPTKVVLLVCMLTLVESFQECLGNESSLLQCRFDPWTQTDCSKEEWAGVICKTKEEECKEEVGSMHFFCLVILGHLAI
jgi:hypothetical protein